MININIPEPATETHNHLIPPTSSNKPQDTHHQVHQFVNALFEPTDILEFRILPSAQSRWTLATSVDDLIPWLI
jgi:hypothetical protein